MARESSRSRSRRSKNRDSRSTLEIPAKSNGHEAIYLREGELMSKLHDLLHSPIGDGVVRILEELHGMLPRARSSI